MSSANKILIVGGYGVVGRRLAAHLAMRFPESVVVAGRNEQRAMATCRDVGHGCAARHIDLDDRASIDLALDGVGTVVSCVAQHEPTLLHAAIARGLAYTDISPRLAFLKGVEQLHDEARKKGARIVLGAGLSPGISNMMAKQLSKELSGVEHIETAILLSLGDEYGPDSLNHVLDVMTQPYAVFEEGRSRAALPFSEGEGVQFPDPHGFRTAYLFPWSDVVYYPKTLGARTSLGRFALDPPWTGRLASLLVRAGARRWLERPGFFRGNRNAIERLKHSYADRDGFAIVVSVQTGEHQMKMTLSGRHQADVTAAGAAVLAGALAAGETDEPGVWLPEQVISHERFFENLGALGWKPNHERRWSGRRPSGGLE
jgi:saccharopine dehydrogenase (NAD+, L-lysine forming)